MAFLTMVLKNEIWDNRGKFALKFLLCLLSIFAVYFIENGITSEIAAIQPVGIIITMLLFSFVFKFENNFSILYKTVGFLLLGALIFILMEYYLQVYKGYLPVFSMIWEESGYRSEELLLLYSPYVINGPIFGTQNAGILSIMALCYISYAYRGLLKLVLIVIALFSLYWSFKITVIISLFIALFILSYTYTTKLWVFIRICVIGLMISLPFTFYYLILIKTNFDPRHITFDIYTIPITSQISDIRNIIWRFPFGTQIKEVYPEHADISLLTIFLKFGYIFFFFFIYTSITAINRLIKYAKKNDDNKIRVIVFYLVVLLTSSIHYPTLITPGILHVYIAFLSLGIISKRLPTMRLSYSENLAY